MTINAYLTALATTLTLGVGGVAVMSAHAQSTGQAATPQAVQPQPAQPDVTPAEPHTVDLLKARVDPLLNRSFKMATAVCAPTITVTLDGIDQMKSLHLNFTVATDTAAVTGELPDTAFYKRLPGEVVQACAARPLSRLAVATPAP